MKPRRRFHRVKCAVNEADEIHNDRKTISTSRLPLKLTVKFLLQMSTQFPQSYFKALPVFPLFSMSFLLVPLALMFQEGIHGKAINSLMGPYIVYVERLYMCEPNLPSPWYVRASHFNPHKPKDLQLLTGNATFSSTYDDSTWVKVIIDVRSNNQWKENAFVFNFKKNGCRAFRDNIPQIYKDVFKQGEVKGPNCTLKAGVIKFNNTPANWTFPNFPIMPYGHYRYRVRFGQLEKLYACWAVDGWIIPKS
ncbi:uncharacterized protein LOC127749837 [Frankliniella occidentalis]|uniref:Uncharacterized protein LOC127749837 n=1 Tax=Frankliniella occidentalis TaxID=133901 RepID=A0A9C6UDJ5_FRAOC|nr:uncharacterized protein LOC127749837 [Frankliniella occidentalis]